MGMVFQHFNLFPHMTVLENITLGPIKVKNVPKEEAKELALYLLKKVGLVNKKIAIHQNYLVDKNKELQ